MAVTSPPMIHPSILMGDSTTAVSPTSTDGEALRRYEKERELEEFYSTYDVWTGIRTAVTLALFFIFTVTLILYKSKCKPRRKYELYPSLEDMPDRPLDYCDYWSPSPVSQERQQKVKAVDTLGRCYNGRGETGSAPLPIHRSVGSYSSLNNSFRVKSLPGSVLRINSSRNSSLERDDAVQSVRSEFLSVPGVRLQSTGSSSDGYSAGSSTHDLTGEMTAMALLGVPGLAPRGNKPVLQLGGMDWDSDHATAEWIQTIDINVIQPTPNISPCGSVRSVSDNTDLARLPLPGRDRVASVISLDSPDFDNRSIGSDSVFMEDSVNDTYSSRSESVDSGTPSFLASPHTMLTPSPRSACRKVQSFRLGINPSASAASPVPTRAPTLADLHRPRDQRSRQKLLQRQQVQDIPMPTITRSGPAMTSLFVPTMGGHLNASCERLAAHSSLVADSEPGSSLGSTSLTPAGSTEDEPMCAVYTVPSLRRCNSATTPGQREEAAGWKRADSAQNPTVRRADSASGPQRESSESSSGSEDASESVSFHLMVPALSIDYPSNDTSRASSPTLSPPSSPNFSPPPIRASASPQPPTTIEAPVTATLAPTTIRGRVVRGNGGRRVLRRQYSQCIPASPTLLRDVPAPSSLPTYVEEDDAYEDFSFPAAPPPSPFRAGQSLFFRRDSGPPSPLLAANHLNRQDSGPSPPLLSPNNLSRQDSGPSPPPPLSPHSISCLDSGPSPPLLSPYHLIRQDSGPSSPLLSPYHLIRQDSGPSPPLLSPYNFTHQESGPSPPLLSPYYMNRQETGLSPPFLSPRHVSRQDCGTSPSPNHFHRQDYGISPSRHLHRQNNVSSPSPNHMHRQGNCSSPSPNHFHRQVYRISQSPDQLLRQGYRASLSSHVHRQGNGTCPSTSSLHREDSGTSSPNFSSHQDSGTSPSPNNFSSFHGSNSSSPRSRCFPHSSQDSSTSSSLRSMPYDFHHTDSSTPSTHSGAHSLQRQDSNSPSITQSHHLHRQDSSPPSLELPTDHKDNPEDSRPSSPSCSVMETSC